MATIITAASQLIRAYNMQNVAVQTATPNPYLGKINLGQPRDPQLYLSSLGTPVFTDLTFKGATYTDNSGKKVSFQDLTLTLVLMTISQDKNIVETVIQGADGEIDEYIGMKSYQITINGILTASNGVAPTSDHNDLHQVLKAPIDIDVVSTYLQNLDIYTILVKGFTYDEEAGGYSKQNFTINAKTSTPAILQII